MAGKHIYRFRERLVCVFAVLVIACLTASLAKADDRALPLVAGHAAILLDPSAGSTLDDILSPQGQAAFQPIEKGDINLSYTRSALWVKMVFRGKTYTRANLSLTPNFLDFVDVYTAAPGSGLKAVDFTRSMFGDHRPLPPDGISSVENVVKIELAPGEATTVYIRVYNINSFTQLNMRLDPETEGAVRLAATGIAYGIWFGGMCVLFVTQLVFFWFDRKPQYPLLAASTLGVILVYFGNLGLIHPFLTRGNGLVSDMLLGGNAWAGMSASALAYASILNLRRRNIHAYRFYLFVALSGIIGIGFALTGNNARFGPYGSILGVLAVLINMGMGWWQVERRDAASQLTAIAFTFVGNGASIAMLQRLGVHGLPHWSFHGYGLAALLQTLLLTGSLAIRLRDAESQNQMLQAKALRQSQAAEQVTALLVAERTRELVEARRTAEDALQAEMESQLRQVRFLEVVSHQYRSPLAAIRANIDGIGLALPVADEANHNRVGRIKRSVMRLVEILEVNLARSRFQGPSFRPRMSRVVAGHVVGAAHQRAKDLLNEADITLEMTPEASSTVIMADEGMLELALLNLLENAFKYKMLKHRPIISLSMSKSDQTLEISVADNGMGIPSDDLPHVFEMASRGSNADSVEGSGLGLFIVQKIVAAHAGTVKIDSSVGEGTKVRITLPLSAR
ncbi:ATP-binding protein [Agrobacterium rosae]|uniref:sensor histidine kinase n=1 Tax=Agrobacterium rosae TaxID=1972867 RepID=UPI003A801F2D